MISSIEVLYILIVVCLFCAVLFFYFNYKKMSKYIDYLEKENQKLKSQFLAIKSIKGYVKIMDDLEEEENGSREKTSK